MSGFRCHHDEQGGDLLGGHEPQLGGLFGERSACASGPVEGSQLVLQVGAGPGDGLEHAMRIQLWPFDDVFHRGSSIRLWIEAPTEETDAQAPLPECDTVLNQPCRQTQTAVASGSMTIG